ncbi:collagen alpha-1(I) chain-like isoform X2 [Pteropus vampyrus]|uniref:Collagen alpha-1(I) chain-like isoform X2 n=1 Tax=Pteropus vampyrus TaxID=132908 RepID=A0A6P6CLZ6_PTEVA|nr:collagen alpha-1(I) chain-like isoform X2 [Pteropus vampyrus]
MLPDAAVAQGDMRRAPAVGAPRTASGSSPRARGMRAADSGTWERVRQLAAQGELAPSCVEGAGPARPPGPAACERCADAAGPVQPAPRRGALRPRGWRPQPAGAPAGRGVSAPGGSPPSPADEGDVDEGLGGVTGRQVLRGPLSHRAQGPAGPEGAGASQSQRSLAGASPVCRRLGAPLQCRMGAGCRGVSRTGRWGASRRVLVDPSLPC